MALLELTVALEARDHAEAAIPELIARALAARCTWTEIGQALGITKQAAWDRYHLAARP